MLFLLLLGSLIQFIHRHFTAQSRILCEGRRRELFGGVGEIRGGWQEKVTVDSVLDKVLIGIVYF